ncbi:Uncharacterized conserved protein YdhG, YjbR/CyaY-like superfamily, DUF1801 family [Pedobacter westerhofensis]|uniref:Uncharacterized conserved protein YdhG, YjbR/CyaY-like superfamily, DUF1801 family n=1 Tax=Pedobacter westerhofensis TaxID=425512 RepID=A0A521CNE8_9SPHI|nr:DUF1801 domain-containing protein [Pedobacter westerhofensis]SMO60966.1 Uncharacterized conserved protein YdhG, YjbR/CyaY-like superfamily, DUF1801 family [Pedobacter westerhofensis]
MMTPDQLKPKNIDEYIAAFPKETQVLLSSLRKTIGEAAPEAEEAISYLMPTYKLKGNLVHFAGYQHHIGFYPGSGMTDHFKEELSGYKTGKGSVQFPIGMPMPLDLVKEIVRFRVKENLAKAKKK